MQVITSGRTQQLKKTMMKMKNKVYARCKKWCINDNLNK
jgi:hypothetical protein